eukprot:1180830-Prorocentrum_minimum.AAC.1
MTVRVCGLPVTRVWTTTDRFVDGLKLRERDSERSAVFAFSVITKRGHSTRNADAVGSSSAELELSLNRACGSTNRHAADVHAGGGRPMGPRRGAHSAGGKVPPREAFGRRAEPREHRHRRRCVWIGPIGVRGRGVYSRIEPIA